MNILKRHLVLTTALSYVLLTACQKQESQQKTETEHYSAKEQNSDSTEIPTFPQDCNSVDTAIKTLEKTYSPEGLNDLNTLFKKCLASVPLEKRYQWLEQSNKVYEFQISKLPAKVSYYITELSLEGNTLNKNELAQLFKKMTPQEQYASKNQKQLYLYQYNLGEGDYSVAQDPRYLSEVFAQALPEADQIYLKENLKQDNAIGGSLDKDAGLSASFTQLGDWIIFWENYLNKYPNSHFEKQVKRSLNEYQKGLFLGAENTPVFEIEDYSVKLDPDAEKTIRKLAKSTSPSGEKAKKFLNYFDNYKFAETPYDEKTGTQEDYNSFMNETLDGVKRFQQNYWNDLIKLLDLK